MMNRGENRRGWHAVRPVVALAVVLAVAGHASPGGARVGDVLRTVLVPGAALCDGEEGSPRGGAAGIVPGGKVGFPKIPVLLVTSCVEGDQAKLFFIDPGNPPAVPTAVVKTVETTVAPPGGWRALTLRADKGDLLACGVFAEPPTARIYAIDISPFNNTPLPGIPDGTATLLANGPANSTCEGIAWDVADKTIFQSSNGTDVLHFAASGGALTPVAAGCPAPGVRGLAVAGPNLFVGCPPDPASESAATVIRRLDKANAALVGPPLSSPTSDVHGSLECDGGSFGLSFRDVVWVKDGLDEQLLAVEIPGGVCGLTSGPPVIAPAACPAGYPTNDDGTARDTDGDALLDCWEDATLWPDALPGIDFDGDGVRDLVLCDNNSVGNPGTCADPMHRDLFVEMDYMQFHLPDPVNVGLVVQAFASSPVTNPDGRTGVRLHVQIGDEMPHTTNVALEPCTGPPGAGDAVFDALKALFFGTAAERNNADGNAGKRLNAKAFAFRYGQVAHNLSGAGTTSGCAEIGGNDFVMSLGSWGSINGHNVGTQDQWTGTFMHELGHTLGLRHGGLDNLNCKPNYPSVMSYTRQFSNPIAGRPLDYSRQILGVPVVTPTGMAIGLDEARLDEAQGVGGFLGGKVAFGPVSLLGKPTVAFADGAINWSKTGGAADTNLRLDLNQTTNASGGCPASPGEILEGFDDWANLRFNFRASVDFADGASTTIGESKSGGTLDLTLDEALDMSLDRIDVKPNDPTNTLNHKSAQTVEVAVFGRSDPAAPLDARDIDPATMTLRGTGGATWALPVKRNAQGQHECVVRDVNHDGVSDLVCKFDFSKGTLSTGETKAVLEAETVAGQPVHSADVIRVK